MTSPLCARGGGGSRHGLAVMSGLCTCLAFDGDGCDTRVSVCALPAHPGRTSRDGGVDRRVAGDCERYTTPASRASSRTGDAGRAGIRDSREAELCLPPQGLATVEDDDLGCSRSRLPAWKVDDPNVRLMGCGLAQGSNLPGLEGMRDSRNGEREGWPLRFSRDRSRRGICHQNRRKVRSLSTWPLDPNCHS